MKALYYKIDLPTGSKWRNAIWFADNVWRDKDWTSDERFGDEEVQLSVKNGEVQYAYIDSGRNYYDQHEHKPTPEHVKAQIKKVVAWLETAPEQRSRSMKFAEISS